MTKPYKYKGVLAQPMDNSLGLVAAFTKNENDARNWSADIQRQITERVRALLEDCGVSPDSRDPVLDALLELAGRHVPGFSMKSGRGRGGPAKSPLRHAHMASLIDEQISKGRKLSEAVNDVAKRMRRQGSEGTMVRDYRRFKQWDADIQKAVAEMRQELAKQ
jgi:hypothetical protein